jgi:hypothetical protein
VLILQQICEVEEVLEFKKMERSNQYHSGIEEVSHRKKQLVNLWNDRL